MSSPGGLASSMAGPGGLAMAPPVYGVSWVDNQPVQGKMAVDPPDSHREREADRIADRVMAAMKATSGESASDDSAAARPSGVASASPPGQLTVQLSAPSAASASGRSSAASLSPEFEDRVRAVTRGPGQPLPTGLQQSLENAMGTDLGDVRIHTDSAAVAASRALNARAFTVGNHVVFGAGQYQPDTDRGRHLLAHELTHVLQQRAAGAGGEMIQASFLSFLNSVGRGFVDLVSGERSWGEVVSDVKASDPVVGAVISGAEDFAEGVARAWQWFKEKITEAWNTIKNAVESAINSIKNAIVAAIEWIKDRIEELKQIIQMIKDAIEAIGKIREAVSKVFENAFQPGRGLALSLGMVLKIFGISVELAGKEDLQHTHDGKLKLTKFVKAGAGFAGGVGGKAGTAKAEASAALGLSGILEEEFSFPAEDPPLAPIMIAMLPVSTTPIGLVVRRFLPGGLSPDRYVTEQSADLELHVKANAAAALTPGKSNKKSKGGNFKPGPESNTDPKDQTGQKAGQQPGAATDDGGGKDTGKDTGQEASLLGFLEGIGISGDIDLYAGVGVALLDEDGDGSYDRLRLTAKLGGEVKADLFAVLKKIKLFSVVEFIQRYVDIPELRISGELAASLYFDVTSVDLLSASSLKKLATDPFKWIVDLFGKLKLKKVEIEAKSKPEDDFATMLGEGASIVAAYEFDGSRREYGDQDDVDVSALVPNEVTVSRRVEPEGEVDEFLGKNAKFKKMMEGLNKVPLFTQQESLLLLEIEVKRPMLVAMVKKLAGEYARKKVDYWAHAKAIIRDIFNFLVKSELPKEFSLERLFEVFEEEKGKADNARSVEIKKAEIRELGGFKIEIGGEFKAGVSFGLDLKIDFSIYHHTDLLDDALAKEIVKNLRSILELDEPAKPASQPMIEYTAIPVGAAMVFFPKEKSGMGIKQRHISNCMYYTFLYNRPGAGNLSIVSRSTGIEQGRMQLEDRYQFDVTTPARSSFLLGLTDPLKQYTGSMQGAELSGKPSEEHKDSQGPMFEPAKNGGS